MCLSFLGLWLGVIVISGVTAAVAFPAMKALDPHLPSYAAYPNPHYMIAAGAIARRVFDIGAVIQYVCASVSLLSAVIAIASAPPKTRPVFRAVWVVLAIGALMYWRVGLSPRMDANLDEFLAAAKAGEVEKADARRLAFDHDHPNASRALSAAALFVLCALLESARKSIATAGRRESAA